MGTAGEQSVPKRNKIPANMPECIKIIRELEKTIQELEEKIKGLKAAIDFGNVPAWILVDEESVDSDEQK
ncbi:MAG: hypothetical protein KatS3mg087_1832 [Patescibacteria group bacterium]|nr:MAG: hypothetical protein KatS3mg087_1832 [Patescibacteria group bacterium]